MSERLTDEELDSVRMAAAGFRGSFAFDPYDPEHTDECGVDDRLTYVPEGCKLGDDDCYTISEMIEGHVAEPIATMLNASAAMVTELRERRAADLSSDEVEALRFAREAVVYQFHYEPRRREKALGTLSVLDRLLGVSRG